MILFYIQNQTFRHSWCLSQKRVSESPVSLQEIRARIWKKYMNESINYYQKSFLQSWSGFCFIEMIPPIHTFHTLTQTLESLMSCLPQSLCHSQRPFCFWMSLCFPFTLKAVIGWCCTALTVRREENRSEMNLLYLHLFKILHSFILVLLPLALSVSA